MLVLVPPPHPPQHGNASCSDSLVSLPYQIRMCDSMTPIVAKIVQLPHPPWFVAGPNVHGLSRHDHDDGVAILPDREENGDSVALSSDGM